MRDSFPACCWAPAASGAARHAAARAPMSGTRLSFICSLRAMERVLLSDPVAGSPPRPDDRPIEILGALTVCQRLAARHPVADRRCTHRSGQGLTEPRVVQGALERSVKLTELP